MFNNWKNKIKRGIIVPSCLISDEMYKFKLSSVKGATLNNIMNGQVNF